MTTVEKLLVQIFERKKAIIEQVRQQTELYSQHVASKLLIDGITPPSWLWDPNASSNSKELNKEELINKLLRPHPQPSARFSFANYPFYDDLVTAGDNGAFSEQNFMENLVFNKDYHRQDDSTVPEFVREDHAECAIDSVCETDVSVNSPENRTDERILSNNTVVEQSISRIQRSRSRQKALELRNSTKSQAKGCSNHKNISNSLPDQIGFSPASTDPGIPKDDMAKWAEPSVGGSQSHDRLHGNDADPCYEKMEMNLGSGRITLARSHSRGLVSVRGSLTLDCSYEDDKESTACQVAEVREKGSSPLPVSQFEHDNNNVHELPLPDQSYQVCHQSCGNTKGSIADCIGKDKKSGLLSDRVTRSKISRKRESCAFDSVKAGNSFDCQRSDATIIHAGVNNLPPDNVDGSRVRIGSSDVHNEGSKALEPVSKDCEIQKQGHIILSSSTSQLNGVEDVPNLEIHCQSTEEEGVPDPSSDRSSRLVSVSNELLGIVKPSVGFPHRVTRSQTRSNDQEKSEPADYSENPSFHITFKSDSKQKSANVELQNVDQSSPFRETLDMFHEHEILRNADGEVPAQLDNDSMGLIKPSVGVFPRVTSSHTRLDGPEKSELADYNEDPSFWTTSFKSDCKQKSSNVHLQNVNESSLHGKTNDMLGDHGISINALSSVRSSDLVNDSNEFLGLVRPSAGVICRVTRSQTRSSEEKPMPAEYKEDSSFRSTRSTSDYKQKSANVELQNINESFPLRKTHDILGEHESTSFLIPYNAKERRESVSHIVPTPSGSLLSVESTLPRLTENEKCNSKALSSSPHTTRIAESAEKRMCSLSDPSMLSDKGISGDVKQLSMCNQSMPKSDCKQKFADVEFQSVDRSSSRCETQDMLNDHENTSSSILSNAKEIRQMELHMVATPSGFRESVKPMQPDYIGNEERSFRTSASGSRKRRPGNSAENTSSSFSRPAIFVEKGISDDVSPLSMPERSERTQDASIKMEEPRRDSFESDVQEDPSTLVDKFGYFALASDPSSTSEAKIHSELNFQNFEAHQEADNMHSEMDDILSVQINPLKLQLKHDFESIPEEHKEEGNQIDGEVMDEGQLILNSTQSENLGNILIQHSAKEPGIESSELEKNSPQESRRFVCPEDEMCDQNVGCSTVGPPPDENSLLERRSGHGGMESWPQLKRRKIEHRQTHRSTAPPISRATMDSFCYKEKNMERNLPSAVNTQMGAAPVPNLTKGSGNSRGCFVEGMMSAPSSSKYTGNTSDEQSRNPEKNPSNQDSDVLTLASKILDEIQFSKWDSASHVQSVLSPSADGLNFTGIDQSMPVFEGFTVDAEADCGELEFDTNGINFDKIDLPGNAIDRASILAEICRSASLNTPMPHISLSLELQETQNLFQSVSDDHSEQLSMHSTLSLNSDVERQLQPGTVPVEECKDASEEMLCSDVQAHSGAWYDWNPRNHYGSPVLWGKLSSHSGSSGKSSSSNPELVCFTIEEDPNTSDENRSEGEHADDVQEKIDSSSAEHSDKRQMFRDLTNLESNASMLVPSQDEVSRASNVDFMNKKLSVTGEQDKVQMSSKDQNRGRNQTMVKAMSYIGSTDGRSSQTLSVCTDEIRRTKDSINNSISRPTLSNKASVRRQDQKLSLKESKRNNIISNVSSFIPLVQQKKAAAAACTGKRDVKVRALEAAEAAKRLEEKKEYERRMKKEALKLERAKLEEKTLKNLELEKKKKEEERKKRDADNREKKRQREEETKKEKEKKRMKFETKQRQREQEEKERAEKLEKDKMQSKDKQLNNKKELRKESKDRLMETSKGDRALEKTKSKETTRDVVMNQGQSCEAEKAMHTLDKSPKKEDLIVQNNQGKSYEISPYQCSDDEDEEGDELPTKKYIPPWASKNSIALLLPLQQHMDPDVVFPPQSFCRIDEVLLPRKQQQKQVTSS